MLTNSEVWNMVLAIVLVVALWNLTVRLLAWSSRHSLRSPGRRTLHR